MRDTGDNPLLGIGVSVAAIEDDPATTEIDELFQLIGISQLAKDLLLH